MKQYAAMGVLFVALLVTGTLAVTNKSTTTVALPSVAPVSCPANAAYMGCSQHSKVSLTPTSPAPSGELIPDVSQYQGCSVNWAKVKAWQLAHGWTPAGIFKLGEYTADPCAAANAKALHAAGMVAIGYDFARPGVDPTTVVGTRKFPILPVTLPD